VLQGLKLLLVLAVLRRELRERCSWVLPRAGMVAGMAQGLESRLYGERLEEVNLCSLEEAQGETRPESINTRSKGGNHSGEGRTRSSA